MATALKIAPKPQWGGGSIPPPHSKSAVSVKLLNILVYFFLKKQMNRFETF